MEKRTIVRSLLMLLLLVCVAPLTAARAQTEWTYVVTARAGSEGVAALYRSGDEAFRLYPGEEVYISSIEEEFPVPGDPERTCRAAIITRDMEDYIVLLDDDRLLVPASEYRHERLLPGLGSVVGRNPSQNYALLGIGVLYLLMMLYAARGVIYLRPRAERLRGVAGGLFVALYVVVLCAETYCLVTFSDPMWFLRIFRVGFFKGVLLLLPMIVYLYLKYAVTLLALYPIRNSHRLEDTEFDGPRALLVTVLGAWIVLSMTYWKALWVPYAMWIAAGATVVGVIYVLRRALRAAGLLRGAGIVALVLLGGATLCYVACEVLAMILQLVVFGFLIYALFASASRRSPVSSDDGAHETYVDDEGNFHDLHRQSDGSYVDFSDNSRWNKRNTGSSRRFDRID